MSKNKKTLIVFDFDFTVLDIDSDYEQGKNILTDEEMKEFIHLDLDVSFEDGFKYIFGKLKEKNKTINDIYENLDKVKLPEDTLTLFNYLHDNKDKYELIILTGNSVVAPDRILQINGVRDYFNDILATPVKIENDEIIVLPLPKVDCKLCLPNACKTNSLNNYILKNNKKRNNYEKIVFVCDGGNDYCLAKNLDKNDILFPRKNYKLYKKLYEDNLITNLKCIIVPWSSRLNILEYLKSNH